MHQSFATGEDGELMANPVMDNITAILKKYADQIELLDIKDIRINSPKQAQNKG